MNKMLFTLLLSCCCANTTWCMQNQIIMLEKLPSEPKHTILKDSNPSDEDITMDTDSTPSPSHASSTSSSNNGSPREATNMKAFARMGRVENKKIARVIKNEEHFLRSVNDQINDTHEKFPAQEMQNVIGIVDNKGSIIPVHKERYQKPYLPMEQYLALQLQAMACKLKHK